jgi:vacuolar-type H+-ATPase subunit H
MGESTTELTHDIAATRERLGTHLDELEDKVSPSAVVERKKEAARSRVLGVKERALGTARSAGDSAGGLTDTVSGKASDAADTAKEQYVGAPIAAGIAAFGLGMVIAALVPASRAEQKAAQQVKDTVQEQAQPLVQDAKQAASEVGQQLKDSATESAQQVKQAGTDAAANVADEGRSSAETIRSEAPGGSGSSGSGSY